MAKRNVFSFLFAAACLMLVASMPSFARARQLAQNSIADSSSASASTSSFIVIESVLPVPGETQIQSVLLRNIAANGTSADVSGWKLLAASDPGKEYTFPSGTVLERGEAIQLKKTEDDGGACDTCFEFDMGRSDAVILQDQQESVVSVASWSDARTRSKIVRLSEGEYMKMPGDQGK